MELKFPKRQRFFIDTEFMDDGPKHPVCLISIAIVSDTGQEYYAELEDAPLAFANNWVQKNVVPHLTGPRLPRSQVKNNLVTFFDNAYAESKLHPELWGYCSAYDMVVFSQIFGCMIEMPKGTPHHCMDIRQLCHHMGLTKIDLPAQVSLAHHALNDARWNRDAFNFLQELAQKTNA